MKPNRSDRLNWQKQANEALRNAIAGLARLDDLDQFLAEMLKVSLEISGAQSGAVDLVDGNDIRHAVLFNKAGLVSPQTQAQQGLLRSPFSVELREMAQRILESEDAWVVYPDDLIHPSKFQAFHREQGNGAIRLVPMRIGDRLLGWLGLGFAETDPPSGKSFVLLRVLAEQMTMAVELLRLAEATKQAAIYEERNRVAREIHDTLAQAFTGISLQLEVAKSLVEADPQAVQQILNHISQLAEAGLSEARRSVWALYPPAAEYADLAQLLYESVEQMTRSTSIAVEINVQGTPCCLPPFIGMNLLRIGQEALTNALKHAQAQIVTIELVYERDRILLTIRDNGRGFTPPDTPDKFNGGFGLVGMYERCDRINAQLSLTSQPGQGTQILVEAPLS